MLSLLSDMRAINVDKVLQTKVALAFRKLLFEILHTKIIGRGGWNIKIYWGGIIWYEDVNFASKEGGGGWWEGLALLGISLVF